MKLLSDRIQEFIDWLACTDFADWGDEIKREVHMKLIEIMTEPDNANHPTLDEGRSRTKD